MNQQERLIEILKLLETEPFLKQETLVDHFNISKDTARRDILKLVEQDLVERVNGGIQLPMIKQQIESYKNRIVTKSAEKKVIAELARPFILEKQTIWLDVSTTVETISDKPFSSLPLIVTNSIDNAVSFSKNGNDIYLLGGYFQAKSHLLKGPMVIKELMNFNFDIAFIGASGISDDGIFFDELDDISLHQQLREQAKQVVLLIDSSKLNRTTAFKINFDSIDTLITNKPLPENLKQVIQEQPINLIHP